MRYVKQKTVNRKKKQGKRIEQDNELRRLIKEITFNKDQKNKEVKYEN